MVAMGFVAFLVTWNKYDDDDDDDDDELSANPN